MTGGEAINFSVDEAIRDLDHHGCIGKTELGQTLDVGFTNEDSDGPQASLSYHLGRLSHEASNIAALVITNHMTMCFVARDGKLIVMDSHPHLPYGGAMIGVSDMSEIESLLANIKKQLSLRENACSVTFVEFPVPEDQFSYMFSQQEVSSDLLQVLGVCLEMSGDSKNLIDYDFLYDKIYKLGHTRLIDVFLTLYNYYMSQLGTLL